MKNKIVALLIVPLLLSGCSKNEDKGSVVNKDISVRMVNHFVDNGEAEFTDTAHYNDAWFFGNNKEVNNGLELISTMVGGAASVNHNDETGGKVDAFLADAGYADIEKNYYFTNGVMLPDSMGVIIGSKTLTAENGDKYTLLAVLPRSGGYTTEWMGNFNVAASGNHEGFILARDEMLRFTKSYIDSHSIKGNLKIWSAGYSRGAAITNLYSAFLADASGYLGGEVSLAASDIYAYATATPFCVTSSIKKSVALSVSGPRSGDYHDSNVPAYTYSGADGDINPSDEKYSFIHNFVAAGDPVAKIPPSAWGYSRFGSVHEIVYGSEAFRGYLAELDQDTADSFIGQDYHTKKEQMTVNLETLSVDDTGVQKSAEEVLQAHIDALANYDTLENFLSKGYMKALANAVATVASDTKAFIEGVSKVETSDLIKALVMSYFCYAIDELGMEENEGIAYIVMELLETLGYEIEDRTTFTDQQFLKAILDLFINDFSDDAKRPRIILVLSLIPDPWGTLLLKSAMYASTNSITVNNFDDLLLLISTVYKENKEEGYSKGLIDALVGLVPETFLGIIPMMSGNTYPDDQYPTVLDKAKAAFSDIVVYFVDGNPNFSMDAPTFRYNMIMTFLSFGLSGHDALLNVLTNGMTDNGEPIVHEAVRLSVLAEDIMGLIIKEGTLEENANKALITILRKGTTDVNADFMEYVGEHVKEVRNLLFTFIFASDGTWSLQEDLDAVFNFFPVLTFVAPAHYFEMYMCYFKTKI